MCDLMQDDKKEREWNDPISIQPQVVNPVANSLAKWDQLSRSWRLLFIGIVYIATGCVIEFMYLWEISLSSLPYIFISTGLMLTIAGYVLYKIGG